jgi:hypothetical protein
MPTLDEVKAVYELLKSCDPDSLDTADRFVYRLSLMPTFNEIPSRLRCIQFVSEFDSLAVEIRHAIRDMNGLRCALCGDFWILMDLRFAHMHKQLSHSIIRSFESLSRVSFAL